MNYKVLKSMIAILLIITLVGLNVMFLGNKVAIAIYEELEKQQGTTNVENIIFDAYFHEEETKKHSKQAKINEGDNLILDLTVKNVGVLEEGKIKLENTNFTIDTEKVKNENIKTINEETNEITLNHLSSGNINIVLPIKFNKEDANTFHYFDQENMVTLTGKYKQSDTNTKDVKGQVVTRLMWEDEAEVELTQEVEKYLNLGEKGILLEQKVSLAITNHVLPMERQAIQVKVPELDGNYPSKVVVLYNGRKLEETAYQWNEEHRTIDIQQEQNKDNIQWGTGIEEYKIIYTYPKEAETETKNIELDTTAITKLYTKEEVTQRDCQPLTINYKGSNITIDKITTPSIDKGYMYANVNRQVSYQEKISTEFSQVDLLEDTITLTADEKFIDAKKTKHNVQNSIETKKIQINKDNLLAILGTEGNIQVQKTDGTILTNINANVEADENGNIIYEVNSTDSIQIQMTKPQQEGTFVIYIEKAINGQTGYTKEAVKTFVALEDTTIVKDTEVVGIKTIALQEPVTEAKLSINNDNLSALENNENIQLVITLKSDEAKYKLWKNPHLYLKLPQGIETIKVNSTQILYTDSLVIESANLVEEDKAIDIQMRGEQTEFQNSMNEGIQIIINADVSFAKTTPSQLAKIELIYENKNDTIGEQKTDIGINIHSKVGALLYNRLEGYNEENEKLETISQQTIEGELNTRAEARVGKAHMEVVNNYEDVMKEVNTIIHLPNTQNLEEKQSTINLALAEAIETQKDNVNIYYATQDIEKDSQEWTSEVPKLEDIQKVKIVVKELQPGESIPVNYTMTIPENLTENQEAYQKTDLTYEYQGKEFDTYATVRLATPDEKVSQVVEQENNGLGVQVKVSTHDKEINNGDMVREGQTIRYHIDVTNHTGKELKNFSLEGLQTDAEGNTNVTFFHEKEIKEYQPIVAQEVVVKRYMEDDTLKSITLEKEKILEGEVVSFQYEFTVNKKQKEDEVTKGSIVLKAENLEETIPLMENTIEKADVKVVTTYGSNEAVEFIADTENAFLYTLENLTNKTLENIELKVVLPEGASFSPNYQKDTDIYEFVGYENREVKLKIHQLAVNQKLTIPLSITIGEIDSHKLEQEYTFFCEATVNHQTYYSNEIEKIAKQNRAKLGILQKANKTGEYAKEGEEITYTTTITNQSLLDTELTIEDNLEEILEIKEAYLEKEGHKLKDFENREESFVNTQYPLKAGETIQAIIKTKVGENEDDITEFSHYLDIYNSVQSDESNAITYQLEGTEGITKGDKGSIRGKVWLDSHKDGIKEETGISQVEVLLIHAENGKVVANTQTNSEGEYQFQNLDNARYLVGFKYDTTKYTVTKYKVEGSNEDNNSDVINRELTIGGQTMTLAVTDEINIAGNIMDNIDAGFYENKIFDLSLKKGIRKIITQSSRGTKVQEYHDVDLAKVELHAKEVQGANVLIEYVIKVTNEGEIPGFVNNVIDYLPKELTFSSEINKDWYVTNGRLYNQSLTNEVIQPGETKVLSLTLTKTMSADTTGTIRNTAEIGASSNDLGQADRDSTPGNKQENEDDISSVEVIVSVSTGAMTIMVTSITIIIGLLFISLIIYQLRKTTVKDEEV